jgi:hypothetical protein
MRTKLNIAVDEPVSAGSQSAVDRRGIIRSTESFACSHVTGNDLEAAYKVMAAEQAREVAALEWAETTLREVADAMEPT